MPTSLAGEDGRQRITLLGVCPFVDIQCNLPAALEHVSRRINHQYRIETIQHSIAIAALVHMPCNQKGTEAFSRCVGKHAGARGITVACFEIGAGHLPGGSHLEPSSQTASISRSSFDKKKITA